MRDDVITLIPAASSGWCGAKKEKLSILKMTKKNSDYNEKHVIMMLQAEE